MAEHPAAPTPRTRPGSPAAHLAAGLAADHSGRRREAPRPHGRQLRQHHQPIAPDATRSLTRRYELESALAGMDAGKLRTLLVDALLPDWVHEGGYEPDGPRAEIAEFLREWGGKEVDRILGALRKANLWIVRLDDDTARDWVHGGEGLLPRLAGAEGLRRLVGRANQEG